MAESTELAYINADGYLVIIKQTEDGNALPARFV